MFHREEKVVCVHAGVIPGFPQTEGDWSPGEELCEGSVYTIMDIFQDLNSPEIVVCTLYEVARSKQANSFGIWGYFIQRFRPLNERKTDISQFTALLNPINHKQLEDV